MTELVFIEGISGVGKSTMVSRIAKDLKQQGYEIKAYLESDFANPIDFYSTAWLTDAEYGKNRFFDLFTVLRYEKYGLEWQFRKVPRLVKSNRILK